MEIKSRQYGPLLLICIFSFVFQVNAQVTYSDTLIYDTVIHEKVHETEAITGPEHEYYFLKKNETREKDDSFHARQLPAAEIKKMQEDDAFWYANVDIKKQDKNSKVKEPLTSLAWFRTLLWLIIIGGFAAFIMIYLDNSDIGLFSRRNRSIDNRTEEEETEDIFAINYQKEIEKAVRSGNYRFAIRLHFLRLLKDLSLKHIIQFKQGGTNFDYLMQLSPTNYYKDFFRITRNYEYSWYGQFEVDEKTYVVILDEFHQFEKKLPYS